MPGVFAKSGVRVRTPHHVGHFRLYSVVFVITVALPLFAESVMEFAFLSVSLSLLLMLHVGSLAGLMVFTSSPLSSSVAVSVMYFATTSLLAMISSTGRVVMAKFKPLLKYSSFIITDLPIAQVHYPPVCVYVGVCHFFLSLRFVVKSLELALLS